MKEIKHQYVKRTQKDYSLSFKLAVVKEVESGLISNRAAMLKYGIQGHNTIREWRRKYGTFAPEHLTNSRYMQTPEQKIKELEQKVKQLEREKLFLEDCLTRSEDKALILDKVIELAEKEYLISVRKNFLPDQSKTSTKKQTNR